MNRSTPISAPLPGDTVEIQTFAFLDLETTGLYRKASPPRITEIAIVAVGRAEFSRLIYEVENKENSKNRSCDVASEKATDAGISSATPSPVQKRNLNFSTPRVLSKLTQVVNPEIGIPRLATLYSAGLTNDRTASMPTFAKFAPTIRAFLENLPRPVCLIAHNGKRFDFRVLESELRRVNATICNDAEPLFLVDSIHVFRAVDNKWFREHADSAVELQGEGLPKCEVTISSTIGGQINENASTDPLKEKIDISPICQNGSADEQALQQNGNVPSRQQQQSTVDGTPRSGHMTTPPLSFSRPVSALPLSPVAENGGENRPSAGTKRRLEPDVEEVKGERTPLAQAKILSGATSNQSKNNFSYSLQAVHQRVFGVDPIGHHCAESDCLSILHIATHYGNEFINHVDSIAEKFNSTPSESKKGKKRKA